MDSTTQIEHRASAWLSKRDSGDWTRSDELGLQEWLQASTAHRISFLRLESAWEESLRLKAIAAGLAPEAGASTQWRLPTHYETRPFARWKSQKVWRIALAASAVVAIGIAYFAGDLLRGERYSTRIGGMASVPLRDGSKVTLNTASKIRVELSERERHVDLTQGEAFFDVAKDPTRPFVVSAGRKRIVAVGTQFSVRRDGEKLRVVVTQGKVRIEDVSSELLLTAGGIFHTGEGGARIQKTTPPETEELLSWRNGYLTFRDTPLSDAVVEFNQYNTHKITIADPVVGNIPLTGKFRATNYEAFIWLLEKGYSIHAQRVEGGTLLASATHPRTTGSQ